MKNVIVLLVMTICILPLTSLDQTSEEWRGEMSRELDGILDRDRISLVTHDILDDLIDEELMEQSPSDAARLMAKMAVDMDRQIRQGVMRSRVIRETIRNRELYMGEKPLFTEKGSRKGAPGSSTYSESRGNGSSEKGPEEFKGNSEEKGFKAGK